MVVFDSGAIPAGNILLDSSCPRVHPGLCAASDDDIYSPALVLARHLERSFCKATKYCYYCYADELFRVQIRLIHAEGFGGVVKGGGVLG